MSNLYTIQKRFDTIQSFANHEELLIHILQVYLDSFPLKDAYLLRYSPIGFVAEGIIFLNESGGSHIGEIREEIRSFPIIYSAIEDKKAKFCTGIDYLKNISIKYSIHSQNNSFLIVPIFIGQYVFGYICSTQMEEGTTITEKILEDLTTFGNIIGQLFIQARNGKKEVSLSKRELEVMRQVAIGESTKEIAGFMNLSELTITQYVKSAIKKLHAKNRSHAISILYQEGILL
ncbi:LuxR C-terminal-related transcriptional regulator [Lysinibacillus irui]|uniref:LuxR C-terminal-related transcriptional regulator n=1 Tax=Lysinibacillus irui TaxID=2998077 RepID=A0AAJ5UQL6_9BACI|nr:MULTISPECIES: LuxR C-terminal-related transcriptional regulator [Lysinibacillus]MEA0555153.1 LuxR C-terminal-related transcriptional regulator [Lysinibacillus irui]MEA0565085.1 LuxR C-terminal-related transcriptional regulator [Lysinibacillus irui]MEA0976868.1 LuxR C-terminal-related transcriptional regulator [Lysinibacillus irui]MEA1043022.1 LuxR C-terminal-related transcriptional regulator [Lysinibacillus irui]WDV05771.1 LuxR C-terminal-related transcriptional regulator [Lysinibacillus ir